MSLSLISTHSPPVVQLQLGVREELVAVEEEREGVEMDVAGLKVEKESEKKRRRGTRGRESARRDAALSLRAAVSVPLPLPPTWGCDDSTHVTARSAASAASTSSVRRMEPSLSSAREDPATDEGPESADLADPPARERRALEAAFFFLASETMVGCGVGARLEAAAKGERAAARAAAARRCERKNGVRAKPGSSR